MPSSLEDVYDRLYGIILLRFPDIVKAVIPTRDALGRVIRMRIIFIDGSFLDVRWNKYGEYSLHWERRHIDGTLYRYDNAPHWSNIATYPHHFHCGREDNVVESKLPSDPLNAVMYFLEFIRQRILGTGDKTRNP